MNAGSWTVVAKTGENAIGTLVATEIEIEGVAALLRKEGTGGRLLREDPLPRKQRDGSY